MANRLSQYSNFSSVPRNSQPQNVSQQMSTTSCLNACHSAYTSGQPFPLESGTSLVVNTWITASSTGPDGRYGGTIDSELARRAWEHARRRAEDGCIILGSVHQSAPSLLAPFVSALPLSVPGSFYTAVNALRPFLHTLTPHNPSAPRHFGLSARFSLSLAGNITEASISLSEAGIDTTQGLLDVPNEKGFRAFDVFYYLLSSTSSNPERQYLGLKNPSQYALLRKSETYGLPHYLPTSDDVAQAEDFRESLRAIGIRGALLRSLLSVLAAILRLGDASSFLIDQDELESICEEVGELLELDPAILLQKCSTEERAVLSSAVYESLVDWVIARANDTIRTEILNGSNTDNKESTSDGGKLDIGVEDDNCVSITVVELPSQDLGKAVSLRTIFDDTAGINAEIKEDGVPFSTAGSSVLREMREMVTHVGADLNIGTGSQTREREVELDRRLGVLEKVGAETESDSFLRNLLYPGHQNEIGLGKFGRFNLSQTLASSRIWFQLCLHPSDDLPEALANQGQNLLWSAGSVSSQIRSWRLPEWANHRNKKLDFTADFDIDEFVERYCRLGCQPGRDGVESWIMERGWSNGEVVIGKERVWIREAAWWEAETMLDMKSMDGLTDQATLGAHPTTIDEDNAYTGHSQNLLENPFFAGQYTDEQSRENLVSGHASQVGFGSKGARSIAPTTRTLGAVGDYGLGPRGDDKRGEVTYYGELDPELADGRHIEVEKVTTGRRLWVAAAWAVTFWIPSFVLNHVGRMKRPDVRMAWREKVLLMILIFFMNAIVVFWIVEFGNLICPNWDKVWNEREVGYHTGDSDFWVSFRGEVFDLSKFWKLQHSDTNIETTNALMQPFAGMDMTTYIVPPLTEACPGLVTDQAIQLTPNTTLEYPQGEHVSGPRYQPDPNTKLHDISWYGQYFIPRMKQYYKGDLVITRDKIKDEGENQGHMWFILADRVFDLTDYFHTVEIMNDLAAYKFLPDEITTLVQNNPGQDLTDQFARLPSTAAIQNSNNCLQQLFYVGKTDFRRSARCQVNNYVLLAFTIVLCAVILIKFLAALQLGSKRRPAQQDKFVICQVPAYTEGEDSLRKGLDSLTALAYDNKRKLICVICDGMIVGAGNDRPTPKIVLDILGVDPKVDPPALPFKSVGQGSDQLNYGKVYSGLYEFEGNVVPYIVVVKVGKESEQTKSKPGNRGKRDSQVLLMSFLNRVHHRSAMNPLELEMFHQINNIIGVDPELYEYLFMVDADTKVKEDSLNRLVAACAHDAKVAGICGETSLENEERSWWTMIQVYEYYISHHLAKAFESLFGSVTCLPGCFCMYRLRTADKGRPLIISDKVIQEYADINVDTLHKKNLLSLGEDRYLTTLMTKHFPAMSYKFIPDAYALTEAPAQWSVLLSQRRRWINSTIHNLAELVFLKDLCGFCCFSMRFVVFIDLFGTIILPATCAYLAYLIYRVASHTGQFPLISIIMLAAVYGLQAIIFIIKRQWQHVGWMIIYLLAYPIWSFILPVYSFWKQDDFSWGNTRVVIGEKGDRQVVSVTDERFDPRSIPLQRWDDYAIANNLPGRRGISQEKELSAGYRDNAYEMDDIQSMYSSVKPASTVLTGFPNQQTYRPPPSHGLHDPYLRQSTLSRYTDNASPMEQSRLMSIHNLGEHYRSSSASQLHLSQDNLAGNRSSTMQDRSRSPFATAYPAAPTSRPASTINLASFQTQGPTNEAIIQAIRECLAEVDLDTVTKKQLKALAEQKLQCQLTGDRRVYLDTQIDVELANM